jgi:regulator of cell morphogenesis and NO signaling
MTITETTTVAQIAAALPSSVRVFQTHGIDFCCGGRKPLAAVCRAQGLSFAEVSKAIEASGAAPSGADRDWTREPLGALVGHIVSTYHDVLREELPRLQAMAAKIARVHGSKEAFLARIEEIVNELSDDLVSHMQKEELVLFPAIVARESGGQRLGMPLSGPISVMEHDHDHAGDLLSELRQVTSDYTAPDWACGTCRALAHGLAELAASRHVHAHLENNSLFPRALDLVAAYVAGH